MSLDPNQPGDEQLDIVRGLKGVRHAFYLDREILGVLREEEAKVRSSANIPVDNEGFTEALKRECVICIVKSIGEEVFPWTKDKYLGRTDIVWLFDSFVLFPQVEASGGESFVMPSVSFPELNESNGCRNVISCSPAPTCDKMIRDYAGLPEDTRLASILVAFDRV